MAKNKKHFVTLYTYIFGSERAVTVQTNHTLEEIENDWNLKTKLINEGLCNESIPQSTPCKEWYN